MSTERKNYTLLQTPNGSAIVCLRCGMISYSTSDIQHKYCSNCKYFHEAGIPVEPLSADEFRRIYNRLYRFIVGEKVWRQRVFPPGHAQHADKNTAVLQAEMDLLILKELIKAMYDIDADSSGETTLQQPLLLDPPTTKPSI